MAALIVFLAFFFCLPSAVKADDLPPVDPPPEEELLPPPVETPVTCPPPDEWVTWPIEEPGFVRPIKEPTGSINIKIKHKNNPDDENESTGFSPVVEYSQFNQPFAALRVNDRSSTAAYNSLVGNGMITNQRIPGNIFILPAE
jgi:hypothetical protein